LNGAKKITDERLIVRNLKNFRVAFLVENGFILLVLMFQLFKGTPFLRVFAYNNMLFLALMVGCWTTLILLVQSVRRWQIRLRSNQVNYW
jgi:hypothetical protein